METGLIVVIVAFLALWFGLLAFGMFNAYRMDQGKSDMTPWWPKNG